MSITTITYAPSKKPYAIDWSTFRSDHETIVRADRTECVIARMEVLAIWVGRKHGHTYVSSGRLSSIANLTAGGGDTIEAFQTNFDGRYGGDAWARWNGIDLWAPGFTPQAVLDESRRLATVLDDLPSLPAGYDGWYSIRG